MSSAYPRAIKYLTDLVKELDPNATTSWIGPTYTLSIDLRGERTPVKLGRELMDDFEVALDRYKSTSYFETIRNRVRFPILIALGEKGLLPEFKISAELLNERGEWLKNFRADVVFPPEVYGIFDHGLELLSGSMERQLSTGLKLPDIEDDKKLVDSLRTYYKETQHFNSAGAGLGSLSFLKAAALCVIMEMERAKVSERTPRLRKAREQEIYSIVSFIRDDPLVDISLPDAMRDYASEWSAQPASKKATYRRELVPSPTQTRLDGLLHNLDPAFIRRRHGAWEALNSSNPDRLSQAANSMVELLDKVIGHVCAGAGTDLATFLKTKYSTHQQTGWVNSTRSWIASTKTDLHATKHQVHPQSELLTRFLLESAERIILVLLEPT